MSTIRRLIKSHMPHSFSTEAYIYSSIESTSRSMIRLLRLLPARDRAAEIRGEIFDYDLSDRTQISYEALSYVWGDQNQNKRIIIGRKYLDITGNLYSALVQLRCREPRVLWIDAVCVDQKDLLERASQVQFMAKIYATASRVVAWLGVEADGSDSAISAITLAALHKGTFAYIDEEEENLSELRERKAVEAKVVSALLERPYFGRMWVLQEVAMARTVDFFCGSKEISEHLFCIGIAELQRSSPIPSASVDSIRYLIRGRAAVPFNWTGFGTGNAKSPVARSLPLEVLVDMFRYQDATDPRDKLYALLGMASTESSSLCVDYTNPWHIVFRTFIQSLIGNSAIIHTWDDRQEAVISTHGCILGEVKNVHQDDENADIQVCVNSAHFRGPNGEPKEWNAWWQRPSTAERIVQGDIVFLLEGCVQPSVMRPGSTGAEFAHFVVVAISLWTFNGREQSTDADRSGNTLEDYYVPHTKQFDRPLNLVWNWKRDESTQAFGQITSWPRTKSPELQLRVVPEQVETVHERCIAMAAVFDDLCDMAGVRQAIDLASSTRHGLLQLPTPLRHFRFITEHWDAYLRLKLKIDKILWRIALMRCEWRRDDAVADIKAALDGQRSIPMGVVELLQLPKITNIASADQSLRLFAVRHDYEVEEETELLACLFDDYTVLSGVHEKRVACSWNLQFLAHKCLAYMKSRAKMNTATMIRCTKLFNEEVLDALEDRELVLLMIGDQLTGHDPIRPEAIHAAIEHPQRMMLLLKCSNSVGTTYKIIKAISEFTAWRDNLRWDSILRYALHNISKSHDRAADLVGVTAVASLNKDKGTLELLSHYTKLNP